MKKSKSYFISASIKQTGSDIQEEADWTAIDRRNFMMEYSSPRGKTCLSLGCGLGRFLNAYIKHGSNFVVGVDLNRQNLLYCKRYRPLLVLADVQNLPFNQKTFDVIDCEAVTCHLPNPEEALKEIERVSKWKAVSFVDWHNYRWINFYKSKTIRFRLIFYIRDLIVDAIGLGNVIEKLTFNKNKILRSIAYSYGNYQNGGFSFERIQKFYHASHLKIKEVKLYEHVVFITSQTFKKY